MQPTRHCYTPIDTAEPVTMVEGDGIAVGRIRVGHIGTKLETPATGESIFVLMGGKAFATGQLMEGERQLAIVAPRSDIALEPGSTGWLISPTRSASSYNRLAPLPALYDMDTLQPPADNPRLKMLQSDAMSINWVRYEGPRDRRQLSPHAHADFSQGGLALEGDFVHHLRTPWGKNADDWREDVHLAAASPSLVVIPPTVEHTTEGTGDGWHLLIDLFNPPRTDFIAKGWMLNAGDYEVVQGSR